MKLLIQAGLILFTVEQILAATDKVVCYYDGSNADDFPPEDIDVTICTHVNYAFVRVSEDATLLYGDSSAEVLANVAAQKSKNANLKVLISIGGWSEDAPIFSAIAGNADKTTAFITDVISNLQQYNSDGIDIDWEYPANADDKKNYVNLLSQIKTAFGDDYVLSVAVKPSPDDTAYDIPGISEIVDHINVMTMDFHDASDGVTGENAPLYPSSSDSDHNANCEASMRNWIAAGAPASKIILGLAFYGHNFQLADKTDNGLGAKVLGEGDHSGYFDYKELCKLSEADGWTVVFDDEHRVPYKYKGDQWISYDNVDSITEKVLYAKDRGLGGVMMWGVHDDDKDGACGPKFALLNAIKNNL